ncbi:MAG TPA: CcmD family protein [Chloroflexota bacterium]
MGTLVYLFAGYAVIWTAMLIYTLSIGSRQKSIQREIEMLKSVLAEKEARTA